MSSSFTTPLPSPPQLPTLSALAMPARSSPTQQPMVPAQPHYQQEKAIMPALPSSPLLPLPPPPPPSLLPDRSRRDSLLLKAREVRSRHDSEYRQVLARCQQLTIQLQAATALPPIQTTYGDVDDINNAATPSAESDDRNTHELAALAKSNDLLLTSYMSVTDELNRVLYDKTDVATEMEWIIKRVEHLLQDNALSSQAADALPVSDDPNSALLRAQNLLLNERCRQYQDRLGECVREKNLLFNSLRQKSARVESVREEGRILVDELKTMMKTLETQHRRDVNDLKEEREGLTDGLKAIIDQLATENEQLKAALMQQDHMLQQYQQADQQQLTDNAGYDPAYDGFDPTQQAEIYSQRIPEDDVANGHYTQTIAPPHDPAEYYQDEYGPPLTGIQTQRPSSSPYPAQPVANAYAYPPRNNGYVETPSPVPSHASAASHNNTSPHRHSRHPDDRSRRKSSRSEREKYKREKHRDKNRERERESHRSERDRDRDRDRDREREREREHERRPNSRRSERKQYTPPHASPPPSPPPAAIADNHSQTTSPKHSRLPSFTYRNDTEYAPSQSFHLLSPSKLSAQTSAPFQLPNGYNQQTNIASSTTIPTRSSANQQPTNHINSSHMTSENASHYLQNSNHQSDIAGRPSDVSSYFDNQTDFLADLQQQPS